MRRFLPRTPACAILVLMLGSCFDDEVRIVNSGAGGAAVVTISAVDASGSESGDSGTFAVSRAGDSAAPLTVTLTVGGTAAEGTDYGTLGTSLIIPAGSQIAFVTVSPSEDGAIEPNETVQVTVAAGAGYTVGSPASATVTIVDNDSPSPIVSISPVDGNGAESGDVASFALTRAGDSSTALTVNVTIAGTAVNGTDYVTLPATVSIPSGSFIAIVTVTPIPDGATEPNETVQLTVAAGAGYAVGVPDTATVTIVDNNSPTPVVTIAAIDAAASESGEVGTFAVLRAGDSSPALTINLTVTGTATAGTDYTALAATVAMPSGSFLALVTVSPLQDLLIEGDETVLVTVAAGAGYSVGAPSNATVTIADVPPSYRDPEAPAGIQAIDNEALAADLGSDGEPRLIYRTGDNTGFVGQIRLVRRRLNGTWTSPVPVSANNTDFKDSVTAFVSRSNDFIHVFWVQRPSGSFDPQVHYAQFNAGDPPVATQPDAIISAGPATNLSIAASFGDVYDFQAAIDRSTDHIAAIWTQDIGAVAPSGVTPIVGLVIGGSGAFGERFALTAPAGGAPSALGTQIHAGTGGAFHALYGSAFHRMRTGVDTWTGATSIGSDINKTMVIAPDGDAYTIGAGLPWVARHRPAGAASVFSAPQNMPFSGTTGTKWKIKALVEPGTEHLHVFVTDVSISVDVAAPTTAVHAAPNLSGAWGPLVNLHPVTVDETHEGDYEAFVDASNTVTVVFRAPEQSGAANILARSRPTGAASVYGPLVNLSALAPFPMADLSMAQNASGNAFVAWRQGGPTPLIATFPTQGEIYARRFSDGAWSAPADDVSRSPVMNSVGPTVVLLSDAGIEHVFWNETTGMNGGTKDVFYSRRR